MSLPVSDCALGFDPPHIAPDDKVLSQDTLPKLMISIAPQYLEKLQIKRQKAIKLGFLETESGDYVPAVIKIDDQEPVNVKVRLKGDLPDHFDRLPFSLRVDVKKGNKILGMSKFSVQKINTRLGHFEAVYLKHLRSAGILAPRYFFVDYYLNDQHLGPMAAEEHVTKELLESQGRRESVILAMDESIRWAQIRLNKQINKDQQPYLKSFDFMNEWLFPFKCFQAKKKLGDANQKVYYQEAVRLIRGYKFHNIYSDQVFDMQQLAKYLVLAHFWVANHGLGWPNIRIYYNPITRLFEPIAFDNQIQHTEAYHLGQLFPKYFFLSFSNEFIDYYRQEFYQLKKQIEEDHLLEKISGWEKQMIKQLNLPATAIYPYENARKRLDLMAAQLPEHKRDREKDEVPPADRLHLISQDGSDYFKLAALLNVNYIEEGNESYLEIANITDKAVKIDRGYIKSKRLGVNIDLLNLPETIPPFNLQKWNLVKVKVPRTDLTKDDIHIIATYDQHNAGFDIKAEHFFSPAKHASYQPDSIELFCKHHPFIQLKEQRRLLVKPGIWKIKEHLIVPTGYTLQLQAGTTLLFDKQARFIVRGPLVAQGSKEAPIVLSSIHPLNTWAGMVVLNPGQPCRLEHVKFQNIKFPEQDDWKLTGAVTFYQAEVTISNTSFAKNKTEDSLNLIRSKFDLSKVIFTDMFSDAVDVDFGEGTIKEAQFSDVAGDAIDISGTHLTADHVEIEKVGDKAVSVGEGSQFVGEYFKISHAGMAIASKDGSRATLTNSEIKHIEKYVYAAYIKKREYDAALLKAEHNQVDSYKKLSLAVSPCDIFIDDQKQKHEQYQIKQLYDGK